LQRGARRAAPRPRLGTSVAEAPRAPRSRIVAWSARQLVVFLEQAREDRLFALWQLLATTGLRRSEALGLRWCDLDLDEARLSVRQTLAYVGTRPVLDEPKTEQSRRLVMLGPETITALKTHRAQGLEDRLAIGAGYCDLDLVFCRFDGRPLNPSTASGTSMPWQKRPDCRRSRCMDSDTHGRPWRSSKASRRRS
jgi:integrase